MMNRRDISTPIRHRGITIPGAAVLAPINTGFASEGVPDERLVSFHKTRAGLGIGIGFVGNVATDLSVRTNVGTPVLADDSVVAKFGAVATAIAEKGTLPGIQLGDMPKWLAPSRKWHAHDTQQEVRRLRENVSNAPACEIQSVLERLVVSAKLARQAGFTVIEIHAAHGYYLSLLLEPLVNCRIDKFSFAGAWLKTLCDDLRQCVGNDVFVAFRVSGVTNLRDRSADIQRTVDLWKQLISYGVDILDVSAGFYSINRELIYPKQANGPAYIDVAKVLASIASNPVIISGGIRDLDLIRELPPNVLVGLARPLLADPKLVIKVLSGQHKLVVLCANTGRCHFGTRGARNIACGRNPLLESTGE